MIQEVVKSQPGKQQLFSSSSADICLYGGAAGGGKTFALILAPLRFIDIPGFSALFLRQERNQLIASNGPWDQATKLYRKLYPNVKININSLSVYFNRINRIQFAHIARDSEVSKWQGTEIAMICFDELTHFTKYQFLYMLSRNRSATPGIKTYMRATCNPDADSWVREFVDWWIDDEGYPIEERCNVKRYFISYQNETFWFNSKEEAKKKFPKGDAKSFTFINSNIYDNKILINNQPGYPGNLEAGTEVDKQRLLYGNWNIKASAGGYFKRGWFPLINPGLIKSIRFKKIVRAWDFGGTSPTEKTPDPDYTVGIKVGIDEQGRLYVIDLYRDRIDPMLQNRTIKNTALMDRRLHFVNNPRRPVNPIIRIPKEPGASGEYFVKSMTILLQGHPIIAAPISGDKETRAKIASAQAGIKNIYVVEAVWNQSFFTELESFPTGAHDDIVDALSDAIEELCNKRPASYLNNPGFMPI